MINNYYFQYISDCILLLRIGCFQYFLVHNVIITHRLLVNLNSKVLNCKMNEIKKSNFEYIACNGYVYTFSHV